MLYIGVGGGYARIFVTKKTGIHFFVCTLDFQKLDEDSMFGIVLPLLSLVFQKDFACFYSNH